MRRTRAEHLEDGLPEEQEYRDVGCEVSPSCLRCPLPQCRYDVPGGLRQILNEARDAEVARLRFQEGVPVNEIAARFGLSRRTVFRILSRHGTRHTLQTRKARA